MDKTLLKGLDVLNFAVRAALPVRISEVASGLGMTKSNANRSLKTLEFAGLLKQNPVSKDFTPTLRLWELGLAARSRADFRAQALPFMKQLAVDTRETVFLTILEGVDVLCVEKIDSDEPVATYVKLGDRQPAHLVSTGLALLSQLSEAQLGVVLDSLVRRSGEGPIDIDELRGVLKTGRLDGFVVNRGKWRDEVWGIGAPIFDASGEAIAALGLSAPKFRLQDQESCDQIANLVKRTAEQITANLR